MKLTLRIWILWLVLALSVISIINSEPYVKLLVFLLMLGLPMLSTFIKSRAGKIFVSLIFIATIIILIYNSVEEGVLVKSVEKDSIAFQQGLRQGQIITAINSKPVYDLISYTSSLEGLFNSGEDIRLDITTKESNFILFTNSSPEIVVEDIPKSRIKTGLDISGGARALVRPEAEISDSELEDLVEVSRNRFNVFGISDLKVRGVTGLSGDKFMLVEVAGATPTDLENILSQQGKFEAKIGNQTAFVGGNKDITSVCRNDATCAAVTGCFPSQGGYFCNFQFTIYLSQSAAQRHADITENAQIDFETGGQYLKENLSLVLDGEEVDVLRISRSLQGQVTTQISIQGSGQGIAQEEAFQDAQESMHQLQTVLITGSLPYKLSIVKLDSISPVLGEQFTYLILLTAFSTILVVSIVIFIRYRNFKVSSAILLISFSEIIIILGIASLIGWNLDLLSIAGILATIGTGVDQQIAIVDEARTGRRESNLNKKIKQALFFIMSAYLTSLFSLIPLYWAGAGLLKGFAITTIIGITAGVFITRPAFTEIVKNMEK